MKLAGCRLLVRHQPMANLLGDQGVIRGELFQHIGAQEIRPAIAHVGESQAAADDVNGDNRGPHTARACVTHGLLVNFAIREFDRADQSICIGRKFRARRRFAERGGGSIFVGRGENRLDCDRAGDFAIRGAAHSIGENEEIPLARNAEIVFVVGTDDSLIGASRHIPMHCFRAQGGKLIPCLSEGPRGTKKRLETR